jgi:triacylglycerol lipase
MNYKLALFLMGVCHQTYCQFVSPVNKFVVPRGYRCVSVFNAAAYGSKREIFGTIIESDHNIIIAFRGTISKADTISDFIASQMSFPWVLKAGKTHRGFTNIYSSARQQIITALRQCSPDKKLLITGHSLGGALATLCALDIACNTIFTTPYVYTFAAPRVGDPIFAAFYNQKIIHNHRIVIDHDLIPYVPPPIYRTISRCKVYLYLHVKGLFQLHFKSDSISKNHALHNYFAVLSKFEPKYTGSMCGQTPSFCPILKV